MTTEKLPKELPLIGSCPDYMSDSYRDGFGSGKAQQCDTDQLLYNALWKENERLKAQLAKARSLTQPTLPEIPSEQDFYNAMYNKGKPITDKLEMAKILNDLCREALKKAGYEEKK